MHTYVIHNPRILRVDRTKPDANGHRGAKVYVQEGVAGPLHILTVSGRACPYNIEKWAGKCYQRAEYRGARGSLDGVLDLSCSDMPHFEGAPIPRIEGDDSDEAAQTAGAALRDLLGLRKIRGSDPARYRTDSGDKTLAGLARTVARVINEGPEL